MLSLRQTGAWIILRQSFLRSTSAKMIDYKKKSTAPAAAMYFPLYLYVVFSLAERKNDIQKEEKVPLRTRIARAPRKLCR